VRGTASVREDTSMAKKPSPKAPKAKAEQKKSPQAKAAPKGK